MGQGAPQEQELRLVAHCSDSRELRLARFGMSIAVRPSAGSGTYSADPGIPRRQSYPETASEKDIQEQTYDMENRVG